MSKKKVEEPESPGWDAIHGALRKVYGDTEPLHWGTVLPAMLGGNDPLDGISAYRSEFGGRAHWHFVTFGYSELYAKESENKDVSGYGYEMTIRVVDPEAAKEPPKWVLSLLQNLARYVFRTGNAFGVGHHTTLNGPIALERQTLLEAAAFVADPQLPGVDTPNGHVDFIQLVGLTDDEYDATKSWDTLKLLQLAAERDPAMLTDLPRESWLEDPEFKKKVDEGTARDGSSMDLFYATKGCLDVDGELPVLGVAANALDDLKRLIRGRLEFEKTAMMAWPSGMAMLTAGKLTDVIKDEEGPVGLELALPDRKAILDLPVKRGDYPLPSGRAVIRIIPIEILDGERKKVVRTVG
ncbi:MAG: suppressor of fused domain protein [Myxococcales bacterium]